MYSVVLLVRERWGWNRGVVVVLVNMSMSTREMGVE